VDFGPQHRRSMELKADASNENAPARLTWIFTE
jgi:hypothetical protein